MKEYHLTADGVGKLGKTFGIPVTHTYDRDYYYAALADWRKIIEACVKDPPRYQAETRDCDNLAVILNGGVSKSFNLNTMGIVRVEGHALNLFPAEQDGMVSLYYCEPQNGEITNFNDYPTGPLEWWMF